MTRRRAWSDITVTDQFCGAGGSSIGATKAGLRVRMAMNHWALAVESHNTNFPDTDHDCCDISASDPRRYPSTDILITSPECTTHSPAGGNRRRSTSQSDLFTAAVNDPTVERSRATMWDVPRFAEYHRYRRIIVENVVEVLRWELFDVWLQAMQTLGYRHKIVSLNSMFCWPTPQSRDRVYINFWRKGDKAPDLDVRPKAPCAKCGLVDAVQTWKNGRTVGKYRTQYVYTCPSCRATVTPYYYAALNAIDFSIAAERIGDRTRPLKDRTLERIRFGLEKYGNRPLIVRSNMTSGVESRVRGMDEPHMTQTASWLDCYVAPFIVNNHMARRVHGLESPLGTQSASREHDSLCMPPGFLVDCAHTGWDRGRVKGFDDALMTMHGGGNVAALVSPFLVRMRGTEGSHIERSAFGVDDPMPAMVANSLTAGLVTPFVITERTNNKGNAINDPLPTVCAGTIHHALIQGAAQISLRDANAMRVAGLDRELMAQGCAPQQGLVSRNPFLVQSAAPAGRGAHSLDASMPAVLGSDRHALVEPRAAVDINDCYFRMLQPQEIGAAMAFPGDYTVLGNKRDRVKQYGNAVTPPVMETLIDRHVQSLTGERVA